MLNIKHVAAIGNRTPALVSFLISLLVYVVFAMTVSCQSEAPKTDYKKDKFSVSYPSSWVFQSDDVFSQVADREIWVKVAENSFVGFYIFEKNHRKFLAEQTLNSYVQKLIEKTLSEVRYGKASIEKSSLNLGEYKGVESIVTTSLDGGRQTHVLAFNKEHEKRRLFIVFFVEESAMEVIRKDLMPMLESISF